MPKNTSVVLSDHFSEFIEEQVASGRFGSASEVVREGLRLLEDHESKMWALREAIRIGDESGPSRAWTRDELIASVTKRANELGKL